MRTTSKSGVAARSSRTCSWIRTSKARRSNSDINPATGINQSNTRDGGTGRLPVPTSTADPSNAFWLFASDSFREGTGDLKAFRADSRYEFDEDSWFKAVRFGVRYSEREQLNKEIGGNWGGISPAWAGGYGVFSEMNTPAYELIDFRNFFRGGVVQGANTKFPYIRGDLLMNYSAMRKYMLNEPDIGTNHPWAPRGNLDGTGAYRPEDISDITEETQNAYVRFDFGHDIGSNGMSIDANVGVRFSKSELSSNGFLAYDDFDADEQVACPATGLRMRNPTTIRVISCRRRRLTSSSRQLPMSSTGRHEVAAVPQCEVEPERQQPGALWRQQGSDASEHSGSACYAPRGCHHDAHQLPERSRTRSIRCSAWIVVRKTSTSAASPSRAVIPT